MDPKRFRSASPQGKPAIHETQPANETAVTLDPDGYVDEQLRNIQTIEGGDPPKKGDMDQLPAPIRYFGYFFMSAIALFVVISILISLFK